MFTTAAAAAFPSAGTAAVSTVSAIAAAVAFSAKVMSAAEECFTFPAGKNLFRFFVEPKAGTGVPAFFINAMVTNKVPVGNFLSAIAFDRNAVRNKIMSFSAVFTSAFMFHWQKPFQ